MNEKKDLNKYDLVVCAIFQDETLFLKEWLEFHKLVGVQHFYLYDNSTNSTCRDMLKSYIEAGEVDLINWPGEAFSEREYVQGIQLPAYRHALPTLKEKAKWVAFIDLDEFIIPVKHSNLVDLLKEYENYAALVANWQVYGTSSLETIKPNRLLIESLIKKGAENLEMNKLVKLIVQPHLVKDIEDPHVCSYQEGYFAVNSKKEPLVNAQRYPVQIDTIRVNHYWFGPYQWFLKNKIPRREKWGVAIPDKALPVLVQAFNKVTDKIMFKFAPDVKKHITDNQTEPKK